MNPSSRVPRRPGWPVAATSQPASRPRLRASERPQAGDSSFREDILRWIEEWQEVDRGFVGIPCLDNEMNVSSENLRLLGIRDEDPDGVAERMEALVGDVRQVILDHFEVVDEVAREFRILPYRSQAACAFLDALDSLTEWVGEPAAKHLIPAFPIRSAPAWMGKSRLEITLEPSESTELGEGIWKVVGRQFDEIGTRLGSRTGYRTSDPDELFFGATPIGAMLAE